MIYFILIAILGIFIFKRALKKITKEKTLDMDIKISKNFELLTGILFIIILIASLISSNLQVTTNTVMCLFYVICRLTIIILNKVGGKNGKNIKTIKK